MIPLQSDTLVLSAKDVIRLLDVRSCIDAIAGILTAHDTGRSRGPMSCGVNLPHGSVHAKAAAVEVNERLFVAVKANVNLPANPARHGRPC